MTGHLQHEYTSGYCIESVFKWLTGEHEYLEQYATVGSASPPPTTIVSNHRKSENAECPEIDGNNNKRLKMSAVVTE